MTSNAVKMMADFKTGTGRPGYWAGVVVFVATCIALIWGGVWSVDRLVDRNTSPVSWLKIHGDRHFTSDADIRQVLLEHGPLPSLVAIDVDQVQRTLSALPWVKRVAVRKEWPSQLNLVIVEYRPVAYWNNGQLMDADGEIFSVPDAQRAGPLPLLEGTKEHAATLLDMLQRMNKLAAPAKLSVTELQLSARGAWHAQLSNDVLLRLGREEPLLRLDRALALMPEILTQGKGLPEYIDLRYDTGAAVHWQPADNAKTEQ